MAIHDYSTLCSKNFNKLLRVSWNTTIFCQLLQILQIHSSPSNGLLFTTVAMKFEAITTYLLIALHNILDLYFLMNNVAFCTCHFLIDLSLYFQFISVSPYYLMILWKVGTYWHRSCSLKLYMDLYFLERLSKLRYLSVSHIVLF